jgi:hypothetical protein
MDYSEVISASGTIAAVNMVNIMAPMSNYGSMSVAWIIPEGTRVVKDDTVCILECSPLMIILEQQQTNLKSLLADLTKLEAENELNRALLEARVKENKASMALSELDSLQMRYAPAIKRQLMALQLEQSRIEERKLQKKFQAEKKIDETEVRQLKSRISQAETLVKMLDDQVKAMTIMAPADGMTARAQGAYMMYMDGEIVQGGGYLKIGSRVARRMPLMTLPDLSAVQVAVEVQEVDYKRIQNGQKAEILVDAANGLKTTGSVKLKSLAGKMDYTENSQMKKYEVILSVDSLHLQMPPGLSARCDIFINRVKDTVVVPTLAIFERDSLKVVYVADNEGFSPVPVVTGLNNTSQTIISKGLNGKETIALVEPPMNYIHKAKYQNQ